jgi:hypothetical protein
MTEQAQMQIGMPPAWLAELIEEIEAQRCDAIYTFVDEQDKKLDKVGLRLELGGEEIRWAKLLFEAGVHAGVHLFVHLVVDAIKRIYRKHVASGRKLPEFIEYVGPDGRRQRIKPSDLN